MKMKKFIASVLVAATAFGLAAMQGVFVVHRKFTKRNSARIEFINQIVYNVVSEVRFRYGG